MHVYRSSQELIESTKEEILRHAPHLQSVDVDFRKGPHGSYHTKIEVKLPHKRLVVSKDDFSLSKGLRRAYEAILKQLAKLKSKNKKRLHHRPQLRLNH